MINDKKIQLISLLKEEEQADSLYAQLKEKNIEVLYDDRPGAGAGEKFADADLIGCPYRIVISKKTLAENGVEFKKRSEKDGVITSVDKAIQMVMA